MEKGKGRGADTLATDNVFTRKEYIERKAICYQLEKQESIDGQPRAIRRARRIVADFPAADVVSRDCYDRLLAENDELRKERPVVRCGECAYCEWKNEVCTYGWCKRIGTFKMRDEYCSDGDRKDGDGDV